ncbi:MAG: (2Fe-2S)-binding protein [Ignavibacteria bacterium]|nr:(2Fe-2S)-binding protein [Ignavibacteria bacterium]
MPNTIFVNENKTVEQPGITNIRKLAMKNGVQLYSGIDVLLNCRGNGLCGTCRVEVLDGKGVSPMKPIEEGSMMGWIPFYVRSVPKHHRLACQMDAVNDCQIKTHPLYEIDRQASKERRQMFFAWSFFGGIFTAMMIWMLLDMVQVV